MPYRVSAVSFLNTIPLIEYFELPDTPDVELRRDLPSRLAAGLVEGTADVALLPVVEHFRGVGSGFVSSAGIACDGAVDSVKFFAQGDLHSLEKVWADRGSRTSAALLRIMLAEKYGRWPDWGEMEPRAGVLPAAGEGVLVIGDRCFEYEKRLGEMSGHDVRCWDLGQMWLEWTDLPFVFAMWTVSADLTDRVGLRGIDDLGRLLDDARDYGLGHLGAIANREAAAGRVGLGGLVTPAAIGSYFRESLRFVIGEREREGMDRFHSLCLKHGIIPTGAQPPQR